MLKLVLSYTCILIIASGCSALKPVVATKKPSQETTPEKKDVKFLEEINIGVESGKVDKSQETAIKHKPSSVKPVVNTNVPDNNNATEKVTFLQIKYALMLDTEIESVKDQKMLQFIDEWYGTKYRLGGTTKSGIDCSAFSQLFFASLYGIILPRTAREQYNVAKKISRTHLKQGDLIFFNTRGGVSHVGVYLQNNKFVHASTSGVMISDMYDTYWLKRFVAVGRMDSAPVAGGSRQ